MRINLTSPKSIRNLALVAAVLLAPVLSYGAASLMDLQKGSVSNSKAAPLKLAKAPIAESEALPADLIEKISEAIVLAETKI